MKEIIRKKELIENSKILSFLYKESNLNFSEKKVKLEYSKILSLSQEPDLNIKENKVKLEKSKILSLLSQEPDIITSDNNNKKIYNFTQVFGPEPINVTKYDDIFSPPFGCFKIKDEPYSIQDKSTTVSNGNTNVINLIQNIENNENKNIYINNNSLNIDYLIQNIRNNKNSVINNVNVNIKNVIQNIENNNQVFSNNNHANVGHLTQNIENNDKVLNYNNCLDKSDDHIQNYNIFLHEENAIILGKDGYKKYLPNVDNINLYIRSDRSYLDFWYYADDEETVDLRLKEIKNNYKYMQEEAVKRQTERCQSIKADISNNIYREKEIQHHIELCEKLKEEVLQEHQEFNNTFSIKRDLYPELYKKYENSEKEAYEEYRKKCEILCEEMFTELDKKRRALRQEVLEELKKKEEANREKNEDTQEKTDQKSKKNDRDDEDNGGKGSGSTTGLPDNTSISNSTINESESGPSKFKALFFMIFEFLTSIIDNINEILTLM